MAVARGKTVKCNSCKQRKLLHLIATFRGNDYCQGCLAKAEKRARQVPPEEQAQAMLEELQ